jgi:hypothetical protein
VITDILTQQIIIDPGSRPDRQQGKTYKDDEDFMRNRNFHNTAGSLKKQGELAW